MSQVASSTSTASQQRKVQCGICDAHIHKNSIQKHQKQHNLTSAEDRACLRQWSVIMDLGLERAKERKRELSHVTHEHVSKIRRELTKVGKYQAVTAQQSSVTTTTAAAAATSSSQDVSDPPSRIAVYVSPRRRQPGGYWSSNIGRFAELYKEYCTDEAGLYLAESNVRNHMSILKKMERANPEADDITQLFTPQTIDAMLVGTHQTVLQNSTRYDYLLILKVSNFSLSD